MINGRKKWNFGYIYFSLPSLSSVSPPAPPTPPSRPPPLPPPPPPPPLSVEARNISATTTRCYDNHDSMEIALSRYATVAEMFQRVSLLAEESLASSYRNPQSPSCSSYPLPSPPAPDSYHFFPSTAIASNFSRFARENPSGELAEKIPRRFQCSRIRRARIKLNISSASRKIRVSWLSPEKSPSFARVTRHTRDRGKCARCSIECGYGSPAPFVAYHGWARYPSNRGKIFPSDPVPSIFTWRARARAPAIRS